MQTQIESQQTAELRQAFIRHLPKRVGVVQRRIRRLCREGWDINALTLLYEEIQGLAGTSGRYGVVQASDLLFSLEVYLSSFVDRTLVPNDAQTAEIERMVAALDPIGDGSSAPPLVAEPAAMAIAPASVVNEPALFPLAITPPPRYWERWPHFERIKAPVPVAAVAVTAEIDFFEPTAAPTEVIDVEVSVPTIELGAGTANERLIEFSAQPSAGFAPIQTIDLDEAATSVDDMPVLKSSRVEIELPKPKELPEPVIARVVAPVVVERAPAPVVAPPAATPVTPPLVRPVVEPVARVSSAAMPLPRVVDPFLRPVAQARRAEPKRIYYLKANSPFSDRLEQRLKGLDCELELFDDADDVAQMLAALLPDLIVVDPAYFDRLASIGAMLKNVRGKSSQRVAMLVISPRNDFRSRLDAMRMGADAFAHSNVELDDVLNRIGELLEQEKPDPYRILIIEDDRSQAIFAESILRKAGMQAQMVTDALAALDILDQFKPDMILMDLYMPGCDGMELTTIIREREDFINIPIVFLSGEQDTDKHFDAIQAGGDDFLSKPIRPKHLISAVTNRVRRARLLTRRKHTQIKQDQVSGLFDRAHLVDKLAEALTAEERAVLRGGIAFLELENPYQLREKLGLSGFEALLNQVGAVLASEANGSAMAARYGDYHFVLMTRERSVEDLVALSERVRARIGKQVFEVEDRSIALSIAAGVCAFDAKLGDAAAMINAAERACSQARRSTQHKVIVYQPKPVDRTTLEDRDIADALRAALRENTLQLLYQPIVSLKGQHEPQYQVLLRLTTPTGQLIPAARAIPIAEREGIVSDIDKWVVSRGLSVLDERSKRGQSVRLFVNQSGATLKDPQRPAWLKQLLMARRVTPAGLVIEVKLPDVMLNLRPAVAFGLALKQLGVKLCLGGFDGSQLAFQLLSHLPVEYLKVADRFIGPKAQAEPIQKEFRTLIEIGHKLGKQVIVPHIEDAASAAKLWPSGADYVQGNFVQQPGRELGFDFVGAAF
jgi:diguanylate cyclase (GGDEF)-like protein